MHSTQTRRGGLAGHFQLPEAWWAFDGSRNRSHAACPAKQYDANLPFISRTYG